MRFNICELFTIRYPIFQGAMARISDAGLAAAVSNAGGLGIIAAGNAEIDIVRAEIRRAKELTNKPFAVNVMLLSNNVDDIFEMLISEGVQVVTTGAGSPRKYMSACIEKGIKIVPVVASVALARQMEKIGASAVIAEGMESGGHIGKLTTMTLLPQVVDAVDIPVIGAGGIADGRGFAAALMLGADGVQIGTRFLSAFECSVHTNYKSMVLKANDLSTVVTGQPTGHPVRVLKNELSRDYENLYKENAPLEAYEELGRGALYRAVELGDVGTGSVMAGQIAALVNKEQSAEEIIQELINDCMKVTGDENNRICF